MSVLVQNALELPCLKGTTIFSGQKGLHNEIEDINVIEIPDIESWLRKNVLILTAFYAIKDDKQAQLKLVEKMIDVGVSGLIIDTEFYRGDLEADLLQLSNQFDFPIIELPRNRSYSDIIKPILSLLFEENQKSKAESLKKEFLNNLLGGVYTNDEDAHHEAERIGFELSDLEAVIAIQISQERSIKGPPLFGSHFESHIVRSLSMLPDLIVYKKYPNIIALPVPHYQSCIESKRTQYYLRKCQEIKAEVARESSLLNASIGVGRPYEKKKNLAKSYQESLKALSLSKQMHNRIVLFDQLKIYKLLTSIEDSDELGCIASSFN